MNILLISGSLRRNSFNTQLAKEAAELLAGRAETALLDYAGVPLFSQDEEDPVPAAVADCRQAFVKADGVWFFTPEYNTQVPGVLKNLIDWMSRPLKPGDRFDQTALWNRPAIISGIGGKRAAAGAIMQLEELLSFCHMKVILPERGFAMEPGQMKQAKLEITDAMKQTLQQQADALLGSLNQ